MTPLVINKTGVGPRKNENLKTDLSLDVSPVEVLKIVNTVVQVINVDSAQHMRKYVRHVVKRSILPKSVILENRLRVMVVLNINHLNTEKLTWTKSPVMTRKMRSHLKSNLCITMMYTSIVSVLECTST